MFPSAAGGAHLQICSCCPSLPFPSVKVHQAAVLVRRFRFSMVAGCSTGLLNCPPHVIPPAMQCYGVAAGTRTLGVPHLLLWELHVSRGVVSMLSARLARSTPYSPRGGAIHAMRGMRGFWQEAMVLCSCLQLAVPTCRYAFAALPFPFLR